MKNFLILTAHSSEYDYEYSFLLQELINNKGVSFTGLVVSEKYSGSIVETKGIDLIKRLSFKSRIDFINIYKLKNILDQNKVNIIYCTESRLSAVASLASLLSVSSPFVYVRRGISDPLRFWRLEDLISYFLPPVKGIIGISNAVNSSLKKSIFLRKNVTTIYPGINFCKHDVFKKKHSLCKLGLDESNKLTLMTIANSRWIKGIDRIVKAAQRLTEMGFAFRWILMGDGLDEKTMLESYGKLNESLVLMGYVPNAELYLSAADLYCQPSRNEGLCYSALKASLYGMPCVFTSVGGLLEIGNERTSYVSNDDLLFVDGIAKIINNFPRLSVAPQQIKTLIFSPTESARSTISFMSLM